ncbi:MAG: glycosyltransferase [Lachnospiraceae bacterium]|nr:glycosyltransferase [Lachnospiraceae bacterium]
MTNLEDSVTVVSYGDITKLMSGPSLPDTVKEYVLFSEDPANLTASAIPCICEAFKERKETVILHADSLKKGDSPDRAFFRPDWSPDFFLDSFYVGGCFAVRSEALSRIFDNSFRTGDGRDIKLKDLISELKDPYAAAFGLFALIAADNGAFERGHRPVVGHMAKILYHEDLSKNLSLYKSAARSADRELLSLCGAVSDRFPATPRVSALILSKDHPDLFIKCHGSLSKCAGGTDLQVVLVDNGSTDENRRILSEYCEKNGIVYIYEPCDFNFSKLCNKAYGAATKELLLFCNDDVEFTDPSTLLKLSEIALRERVGLCGCKLLYPDGRIQHAGVYNVYPGPMHKLQFRDNSGDLYFGTGSSVINVMSATAACVMVRRSVFDEAGGFDEELAVAFNDVALGFKINSLGYSNVCRNDLSCLHCESATRGNDALDKEKIARLIRERNLLYDKFPEYRGYDPYLNDNLDRTILDSGFLPKITDAPPVPAKLRPVKSKTVRHLADSFRDDAVVNVGIEYCGAESDCINGGSKDRLLITGFCFVGGYDNSSVGKKLILRSGEHCFEAPLRDRFRPDIEHNVPDQKKVSFAGFAALINRDEIAPGNYDVLILAYDRLSGLKLLRDTGRRIVKE